MSSKYVAYVSTPGYMPEGEPEIFDTASEAWGWLVSERQRDEDDRPGESYSQTVLDLEERERGVAYEGGSFSRIGTVYGSSPGCEGDDHDLGLAYTVDFAEDEDE